METETLKPDIELPIPDPKLRWVVRRKAAVIVAIRAGQLSVEEACRRYNLSAEELGAWEHMLAAHGIPGLRITRFQIYRDTQKQ